MVGASDKYMSRLFRDGKAMFLAYDQGLEHGPKDFNDRNFDPSYVIDIALRHRFTGLILHKGLAEKYHENYSGRVPLIVKVNGKDNIAKTSPFSPVLCSVDYAVRLGADAVGYTLYVGSPDESRAMEDFRQVQERAHDYGLPVIGWMYPRGEYRAQRYGPDNRGLRCAGRPGAGRGRAEGEVHRQRGLLPAGGADRGTCEDRLCRRPQDRPADVPAADAGDHGSGRLRRGRGEERLAERRPGRGRASLEKLLFGGATVGKAMEVLS